MMSKVQIDEQYIQVILYEIVCSLYYLHAANIIHRDLKSSNILIDDDCTIMLCDFGMARTLPEHMRHKKNGNSEKIRRAALLKVNKG